MERLYGGWGFNRKDFAPERGLTPDPSKSGYSITWQARENKEKQEIVFSSTHCPVASLVMIFWGQFFSFC